VGGEWRVRRSLSETFTDTSAFTSAARLMPSAARLIRFEIRLLNCTVSTASLRDDAVPYWCPEQFADQRLQTRLARGKPKTAIVKGSAAVAAVNGG
jgi:hypothetical protein